MLMDTGYLADLHRSNMTLKFGGVARITEEGIETQQGEEIPLDVIIFATGFVVVSAESRPLNPPTLTRFRYKASALTSLMFH